MNAQQATGKALEAAGKIPVGVWYGAAAVIAILMMRYVLDLSGLSIFITVAVVAAGHLAGKAILAESQKKTAAQDAGEMHRLSKVLLAAGALMTLIELVAAGFLYQSFGYTPIERVLYFSYGFMLGLLGSLFLPLAAILWRNNFVLLSMLVFALWILVLFPIATQTHLGVMAKSQADLAAGGMVATALQIQVSTADALAQQYKSAEKVDVAAVTTTLGELQAQLQAADAKLAACPANHKTNCIKPAHTEIAAIQAGINKQDVLLASVNARNAALQDKGDKAMQLAVASSGGATMDAHPLFISQGRLLNWEPQTVQAWFIGASALAFTVLTAVVLMLAGVLESRAKAIYAHGYVAQDSPPQPQQRQAPLFVQPAVTTAQYSPPTDMPAPDIGDRPGTSVGQRVMGFVPDGFTAKDLSRQAPDRLPQDRQTDTDNPHVSGETCNTKPSVLAETENAAAFACIEDAIFAAYFSGELNPEDSRDIVRPYLVSVGFKHPGDNTKLGHAINRARKNFSIAKESDNATR